MKKKKQTNIFEFDLNMDAHKVEFEIEPGYSLYLPWLHREFWQEQQSKQGEFALERRVNAEKKHLKP